MSSPRPSTPRPADPRLLTLDGANPGDVSPATVGLKAANLIRMADAGLPTPPGFVLTTQVCSDYHAAEGHLDPDIAGLVTGAVAHIERATGRCFGAARHPLLVSVRSGAPVSMPGMLDTVLNIGLCDSTLPGLLRATGDPVFVWDCYRRLICAYAETVAGCPPAALAAVEDEAVRSHRVPDVTELDVAALRDLVGRLHETYRSMSGEPFPQDPVTQLLGAVRAVLRSWNSERAVTYRRLQGLPDHLGTAVTVQAMVFGNLGVTSGSGVGFTRNPATGANQLYVDFLPGAQGEDIVAGRHSAGDPQPLIAAVPGLAHSLETVRHILESTFGDAQDFEFTVENGKLWLLQTRTAKRTPWAALHIACDLVNERVIDQPTALDRLRPYNLDHITRTRLISEPGTTPIGRATPANTGVATGRIALHPDTARHHAERGEPVILVRDQASTDDIAALAACRGLLTATGARTCHAAVVARQLGIVCLVSCPDLHIDTQARWLSIGDHRLNEDDTITINGATGNIYSGALEVVEDRPQELIDRVRTWQEPKTA